VRERSPARIAVVSLEIVAWDGDELGMVGSSGDDAGPRLDVAPDADITVGLPSIPRGVRV